MSDEQLEELNVWVAHLMEERPAAVPLAKVRGEDDHLYNSAGKRSPGGWWKCETGIDAEDKRGAQTPCRWLPAYSVVDPFDIEDHGAAMLLQQKCAAACPIGIEISSNGDNWFVERNGEDTTHATFAPTLELAVCMFARELFSKS